MDFWVPALTRSESVEGTFIMLHSLRTESLYSVGAAATLLLETGMWNFLIHAPWRARSRE